MIYRLIRMLTCCGCGNSFGGSVACVFDATETIDQQWCRWSSRSIECEWDKHIVSAVVPVSCRVCKTLEATYFLALTYYFVFTLLAFCSLASIFITLIFPDLVGAPSVWRRTQYVLRSQVAHRESSWCIEYMGRRAVVIAQHQRELFFFPLHI